MANSLNKIGKTNKIRKSWETSKTSEKVRQGQERL